ncbi:hypothetical protein Sant_2225 [Sodalis praecaptivus]|uniref:DUF218 domain-containing protein n=1 Tax=Sodalis praecaptivus TaxID=1239307 RepID=W0HYI0_9GAMM|nr:ElyC/SanA/YdcF family protein [Sodalis praecaptivus]AHF77270.1 hypothetical protein Sant_2225 [Sodalis praecaptivus]
MDWQTLRLEKHELATVNTLCRWLGDEEWHLDCRFDAIIIAGNAAIPTLEAGFAIASRSGKPLWLVGGIGHATHFLVEAVKAHPRYAHLDVIDRSEAEIMSAMAACWDIPARRRFTERRSRNTGENALFTLQLMAEQSFTPRSLLLMQDPLLQRRTGATFRHVWQQLDQPPRFINWPGWSLHIAPAARGFTTVGLPPPWEAERFFALMMGEIPRLRNDGGGYGPRGQGFIGEVTVPDEVEESWQRLRQRGLGLSRL